MKIKKVIKVALVCLGVGMAAGFWLTRGERRAADVADLGAPAVAEPAGGEVPGELVVDFRDDVDDATIREVGKRLGLALRPESRYSDADKIYVAAAAPGDEAADLAALRADPRVESAEDNVLFGIPEAALDPADEGIRDDKASAKRGPFPNDPRADEQWHMKQIHMPETWPNASGEGVIVAVIDTGVSHVQDLAQTEFVAGWNFVNNSANTDDDHGHGTHVAGTIAQSTNNGVGVTGVAPRARIMPLKVLSASGSGSVAGIAEAVRWAADHDAKVINMSLGGPMNAQVLGRAVKYAHDKGVTVVCAAGNDGRGTVSYPAANKGAVAVASTQMDEKTAFYSNWGKQIAIAGPGGNTRESPSGGVLQNTRYQNKDDYYFFMGTSMAAPHIAGVAALVVSQGVTDPDAVLEVLRATARKPTGMSEPPADFAAHYGAGIVDAQQAVAKAQSGRGKTDLAAAAGVVGIALLLLSRGKNKGIAFGAAGVVGAVIGASGLFFLPSLGLGGLPGASLVAHGFPAWDQALLGAAGHGNPIFYSALVPVALIVLFYGWKRGRGLLAGFALGVAGHLFAEVFAPSANIRYIPADSLWLGANGLIAAVAGWLTARR